MGNVYVTGPEIVPGGFYQIQAVHESCNPIGEPNYSDPLGVPTGADWADVVGDCAVRPCTGPDGTIDFIDIAAIVEKFKDVEDAPIKARVDLAGDTPDMIIDFVDISSAVEAFRGFGYPFDGPTDCP